MRIRKIPIGSITFVIFFCILKCKCELPSNSYGPPPKNGNKPAPVYGPPSNGPPQKPPGPTSPSNSDGSSSDGESGGEAKPEPFNFMYEVKDAATGNEHSHMQESDGKTVKGEYKVLLPDGRNQVVTYTADDSGFNADVKYDGEAQPSPVGGSGSGGSAPISSALPVGGGYPSGPSPKSKINGPSNGGYPPAGPPGGNSFAGYPPAGPPKGPSATLPNPSPPPHNSYLPPPNFGY